MQRKAVRRDANSFLESAASNPSCRSSIKSTIYIQPIGDEFVATDASTAPDVAGLARFFEAYFAPCRIQVLPIWTVVESDQNRYLFETGALRFSCGFQTLRFGQASLFAPDLKAQLKSKKKALDSCLCIVGITLFRLHSSHGAILGEATLSSGAALVRAFGYNATVPTTVGAPGVDLQNSRFRRVCQVMAHETAHALGLDHCVYFLCGMSGAVDVEENDRLPMHMCPVCLHKLQLILSVGLVLRYERLLEFYSSDPEFDEEASWVTRRLAATK